MISTQTRISLLLTLAIEIPPFAVSHGSDRISFGLIGGKCGIRRPKKMHNYFQLLLAAFFCSFYLIGNAGIVPPVFPKYQITNKEIRLKHGKLHPHDDPQGSDDDHLVYRYRWLGDDIVKTEDAFEGEIDEEYTEREKKVKLPGGCELTEDQFLELESFKKETYYVKKCYCEQGGVYCQLNKTFLKENFI